MSLADHLDMERTILYRAVYILEKGGRVKSNSSGEGITKILELTASGEKITTQAHKKWEAIQISLRTLLEPRSGRSLLKCSKGFASIFAINKRHGNLGKALSA